VSTTINERVIEAEKTSIIITEERESFRTIAARGSVLYFVIADLSMIDPMYQYSLEFFAKLFNRRLEMSEKSEHKETRVELVVTDITLSFYTSICRGLFEKDKLMYSFLNTSSILRKAGLIDHQEWAYFLRGSTNTYPDRTNKCDFLSDKQWEQMIALEEDVHYNFKDLSKSFQEPNDTKIWKSIMTSENPQKISLPAIYEDRLSSFQKVMLMKLLREPKMTLAAKVFVKKELGKVFIESPPFDLTGSLADSTSTTPIIFIITPGSDPIANLVILAKSVGMGDRLKIISLGQGQDKEAVLMMEEGQKAGNWVCLQNCHLYISWMPELERMQEKQDEGLTSPDYRLWLTTTSSPDFPVPVL